MIEKRKAMSDDGTKSIRLLPAVVDDAEEIYQMEVQAFLPLYEKYHDDETSPVKETPEIVRKKIQAPDSEYYRIVIGSQSVGAVRVTPDKEEPGTAWISPIFVLPQYQNRGIAQTALRKLFEGYADIQTWRLATIKQEAGNCYLYEKCGFVKTGAEHEVNERMTLIDYERNAAPHH